MAVTGSNQATRGDAQRQHGQGDDQRAGPGQRLPILVRTERELENDHRQARHRRVEVRAPELIVQRGEQERRGLAADAGDGQQHAGDHAGARGAVADPHDRQRARHADRRGGFAQRVGNERQHVLGRAHHDRYDDHGERHAAGKPEKWPIGATITS
jgi:hypothetical protein